MARRMFSVDQISSEKSSFVLYQHNITLTSYDDTMQAFMTVYSTYSQPITTKQELTDNLLTSSMPATGTADSFTKLIFLIDSAGQPHYTDMQGNQGIYSTDYTVEDTVVAIGG